jgi:hypothetical protein
MAISQPPLGVCTCHKLNPAVERRLPGDPVGYATSLAGSSFESRPWRGRWPAVQVRFGITLISIPIFDSGWLGSSYFFSVGSGAGVK